MISRIFPSQGHPGKPRFLHLRSSRWFITVAVAVSIFTDLFLYGLIVPVTPTALEERVGIAKGDEQRWTSILLALYGAALFAAGPISGYVADRTESRRWPFLIGLVALAVSTSLLCVGTTLGLWIAGRIFQGASAAVVWTVGLALLVDTIEKEHLGQFLGYLGMAMSLGTMTGPLLGGVIYQSGGYYAVFGTAFGLIGVDILLRIILVEKKHAQQWLGKEVPEELTSNPEHNSEAETTPNLRPTANTVKDEEINTRRNTDCETDSADGPSSAIHKRGLPAIFILLSSPRLLCAFWGYFIMSLLLASFDSVLPLFVSDTFHWKQAGQGLIFIPISVPHIIEPVVGGFVDRYPCSRRYLASGAFLSSIPLYVCLRFVTHDSMQQKVLLCGLLALLGGCIAFIVPVMVFEINAVVVEKERMDPDVFGKGGATAQAYGLSTSAFAAGSLVGPFFAGFIRNSAGWGTMAWALGIISGVSALPVLLMLGGQIGKRNQEIQTTQASNAAI